MADAIDQEIDAIKTLLEALEPLSARARQSALEYVLRRLEIDLGLPSPERVSITPTGEPVATIAANDAPQPTGPIHIKSLKEQKNPRSASEMAAVVAYYLSHEADQDKRKDSISTSDIETWFKIAEFKLPERPEFTLVNAKRAGYLKQVDRGQYALNPVGYNLVAHSLPRDGAARTRTVPGRAKAKRAAKKAPRKKSARKKASKKGARKS